MQKKCILKINPTNISQFWNKIRDIATKEKYAIGAVQVSPHEKEKGKTVATFVG